MITSSLVEDELDAIADLAQTLLARRAHLDIHDSYSGLQSLRTALYRTIELATGLDNYAVEEWCEDVLVRTGRYPRIGREDVYNFALPFEAVGA